MDCSRQIATVIYILNVFNSNGLGQFSFEMKNVEFHELSFFMYNVLFTASVCCVPSQTPIYRVVQTTPGHWLIYLLGKLTSLNQWVPIGPGAAAAYSVILARKKSWPDVRGFRRGSTVLHKLLHNFSTVSYTLAWTGYVLGCIRTNCFLKESWLTIGT